MKIFIPSKDRAWTIRTHRLLHGADYFVVLHDYAQACGYRKNPAIPGERIIFTNLNEGLGAQRAYILDNLVKPGEWYLQIDDNLNHIYVLAEPYFSMPALKHDQDNFDNVIWRRRYRKPLSWPLLKTYLDGLIEEAERRGVELVGFASNESPMYRDKKWREFGFVNGKMMLIKKGAARFDPALVVKSDYGFTVENMIHRGRVLLTDYIYPDGKQGQRGGCGPLDLRAPKNIAAAALLMELYPGLFKYKERPGRAPKSEIVFAVNSVERFSAWKEKALLSRGE